MSTKPLNPKQDLGSLPATNLRLGDFTLRSPESRALARLLLDRRQPKTDGAIDPTVQALENQKIYEPRYIRDQYGIEDPVAEAVDEYFSHLLVNKGSGIRIGELPTAIRKWFPKTLAQWSALQSEAYILLFGGAAGSLKSATMLMDAASEFRNPNFLGVIFRESYPNLQDLIKKAFGLFTGYPYFGEYNKTDKVWRFPTNAIELADPRNLEAVAYGRLKPDYVDGKCAQIMFRYMANDDDVYNYQSFEFSFVGFDESTHHSESQIRYLLSRIRSTNPTLRLRMRLGTNPGGLSHDFHLKMFLGVCPHCHPNAENGRRPYEIYADAKWPDGTPLSQRGDDGRTYYKTTQFIPGNVSDHELFGEGNENYKANLRLQRPATAKALLEGCWSIFEGQYFNCWDESRGVIRKDGGVFAIQDPDMRMAVSRKDIQIPYWYPHFIGADYGFTISSAAAYLFVRTPKDHFFPEGRIYVLDEVVRPGILAEDFAELLLDRWLLQNGRVPDPPRSLQLWALSPDAWARSGIRGRHGEQEIDVALTRADQMNEKLYPYRMAFTMANNDRQGGWQNIYRMLRSGELVVCGDTCPKLVAAIPSRVHDPDKEDDILKVKGDELDDCMDAFRYGLYTWVRQAVKPIEVYSAEVMRGLDPTSAMIAKRRIEAERLRGGPALPFGGQGNFPAQRRDLAGNRPYYNPRLGKRYPR